MLRQFCSLAVLLSGGAVQAAEPGTAPPPHAVRALAGCWRGEGRVQGKPVIVTLRAGAILQEAMVVVDSEATATADPRDRYSAHLLFGGGGAHKPPAGEPITGFWADSFGGSFTATGVGAARRDGFDMVYRYPGNAFVNRWRFAGEGLSWSIVARDRGGREAPFASYALHRVRCEVAG